MTRNDVMSRLHKLAEAAEADFPATAAALWVALGALAAGPAEADALAEHLDGFAAARAAATATTAPKAPAPAAPV